MTGDQRAFPSVHFHMKRATLLLVVSGRHMYYYGPVYFFKIFFNSTLFTFLFAILEDMYIFLHFLIWYIEMERFFKEIS